MDYSLLFKYCQGVLEALGALFEQFTECNDPSRSIL